MPMMRISPDGKDLICRNCLERKTVQKQEAIIQEKTKKQELSFKEYFCKKCKYSFKKAKRLSVSTCPYCSASGSIMVKGSTAKIIADAAKMKGDF